MADRPIYFDYHATTPVDPRVAEVILRHMTTDFGNASSVDHAYGDAAQETVSTARRQVAALVGTSHRSVVFTSGATESINLALRGLAYQPRPAARPLRVGVPPTEHKAVLDTCAWLARGGHAVVVGLTVDRHGRLDLGDLEEHCRRGLDLVCVMAANNEVGTITPMDQVGALAARYGVAVLCDATQAAGKISLQRDAWQLTFLALSAHKFQGPKGAGALIVPPDTLIEPLLSGGGHERGLRSGTLNVSGIAGLGEAARLRRLEMAVDEPRIAAERDYLQGRLLKLIPGMVVNGDQNSRLAGNLHFSVPDVPNSAVVARLRRTVALSTGAACSSGIVAPSHVLRAIGLPEDLVKGALRIGLGKFTTREEIDRAAVLIAQAVSEAREVAARLA